MQTNPIESSEWGLFHISGKCIDHGLLESAAKALASLYGEDYYADQMDDADWED